VLEFPRGFDSHHTAPPRRVRRNVDGRNPCSHVPSTAKRSIIGSRMSPMLRRATTTLQSSAPPVARFTSSCHRRERSRAREPRLAELGVPLLADRPKSSAQLRYADDRVANETGRAAKSLPSSKSSGTRRPILTGFARSAMPTTSPRTHCTAGGRQPWSMRSSPLVLSGLLKRANLIPVHRQKLSYAKSAFRAWIETWRSSATESERMR
jgi:hypothetical protein